MADESRSFADSLLLFDLFPEVVKMMLDKVYGRAYYKHINSCSYV